MKKLNQNSKKSISLKNIASFIEGNSKFFYDKLFNCEEHIKEQYYWRLYTCKDTCLITGNCEECGCPVIKKAYVSKSCNPGKIEDLMRKPVWVQYKKDNNISQELLNNIKEEIDEYIKTHK